MTEDSPPSFFSLADLCTKRKPLHFGTLYFSASGEPPAYTAEALRVTSNEFPALAHLRVNKHVVSAQRTILLRIGLHRKSR